MSDWLACRSLRRAELTADDPDVGGWAVICLELVRNNDLQCEEPYGLLIVRHFDHVEWFAWLCWRLGLQVDYVARERRLYHFFILQSGSRITSESREAFASPRGVRRVQELGVFMSRALRR